MSREDPDAVAVLQKQLLEDGTAPLFKFPLRYMYPNRIATTDLVYM